MNVDSSYNPYTSSSTPSQPETAGKPQIKGFVKIVCILFIVLGALGLLGTLQAIASLVLVLFMDEKQFNPMKLFPGAMAVSIGVAAINGVVSVLEIVGGILGLKQKRAGANLIRFISGFMLVLKVAETTFVAILNYLAIGPTIEQTMKNLPPQQANGPDMGMVIQGMMFAGIAFAIFIAIVMFVFYLFSFLTFSKQKTLSQFS
ncbi:MAG: hypothetical protein NTY15_06595 [Planctomycetota bacterium]|nr:hypothetical protein [Planctomycetota bacterium]